MAYECQVQQQPERAVLSIRRRTAVSNLPEFLGRAYGSVAQYLAELGEQPAGRPYAAYYNMDMQNLDVEAGFPISKDLPGKGNIQASRIPGGKAATCVHVGPNDKIEPAYAALTQWIKDKGYEATGVAYEFYLNDPEEAPPEELATQIVFPLKMA